MIPGAEEEVAIEVRKEPKKEKEMTLKELLKHKLMQVIKKEDAEEIPEWNLTEADKEKRMIKFLSKSKKYKK